MNSTREENMKKILGVVLLLAAGMAIAGPPTKISPSGDNSGVTDQNNIRAALEAAGSDNNARVQLAAGDFYLNGGIRVVNFQGTLSGAGKDKTTLTALGTGNPANRGSVLLFVDGSPTVADLSINVPEGSFYLDSSPTLGTSDGGAAIDIFGGSASIMSVRITSNGPFLQFGEESLESGILVHNCYGDFSLQNSNFERVKRAFVFNPEESSNCNLVISGNDFTNNRSGIFLTDFGEGNDGSALIHDNTFNDNLVGDSGGLGVEYAVDVTNNIIRHDVSSGNSAIEFDGTGPLTISGNKSGGQYFNPNIFVIEHTGDPVIADNTVTGASIEGFGSIGVESSDDIVIANNNIMPDQGLLGPGGPGLSIVDSQDAWIAKNQIEFPAGAVDPVHIFLDGRTRDATVRGKGNETVVDAADADEGLIVNDIMLDLFADAGNQVFELSATPTPGGLQFVVIESGGFFFFPGFYFNPNTSPATVTLNNPLAAGELLYIQYESTDVLFTYTGCGTASAAGIGFDRSSGNTEIVTVPFSSFVAGSVQVETLLTCAEVEKNNRIVRVREVVGF
jgi:hypothetical protein